MHYCFDCERHQPSHRRPTYSLVMILCAGNFDKFKITLSFKSIKAAVAVSVAWVCGLLPPLNLWRVSTFRKFLLCFIHFLSPLYRHDEEEEEEEEGYCDCVSKCALEFCRIREGERASERSNTWTLLVLLLLLPLRDKYLSVEYTRQHQQHVAAAAAQCCPSQ